MYQTWMIKNNILYTYKNLKETLNHWVLLGKMNRIV